MTEKKRPPLGSRQDAKPDAAELHARTMRRFARTMARLREHELKEQREESPVKASRKLSRGSFIMQVAGDARAGGKGKGGPAGDHDLAQPPGAGGGADPDSGPPAGPDERPR